MSVRGMYLLWDECTLSEGCCVKMGVAWVMCM